MNRSTIERAAFAILVLILAGLVGAALINEPEPENLCQILEPISIQRAVGISMNSAPQVIETLHDGKITIVTCNYRPTEGGQEVFFQARLQPGRPQVDGVPIPAIDRVRKIADPEATLTDYRGIADGLVWNNLAKEVVMFKGDSVFFLRIKNVPDAELEKMSVDLAIFAAQRLERAKRKEPTDP